MMVEREIEKIAEVKRDELVAIELSSDGCSCKIRLTIYIIVTP